MKLPREAVAGLIGVFFLAGSLFAQRASYPWRSDAKPSEAIAGRIPPPAGFRRPKLAPGSFEHWLRHLPLKAGRPSVLLHNGRKKPNQTAHFAVLDIDVGKRDLQQCADAVIRLRAEYLFSIGRAGDVHFNFTSGDRADFSAWAEGYRPVVRGNKVTWVKSAAADSSYRSFRKYLDVVFMYAGTASLSRELTPVRDVGKMKVGDVFIRGGFPGHAVIVADLAVNPQDGRKVFLLVQSFMPAQDMHVLRNPNNRVLNPWYELDFGEVLRTPEWTFRKNELRRF